MSPSNVLKFPTGQPNDLNLKLFAVIFYCFLAFMLTLGGGMTEGGFTLLLVLGLIYNFMVRQKFQHSAYFQQNKVLLIILLVIFLLAFRMATVYLLILAGIYWLLVGRSGREAPYFLRFHILTGLILNGFILLPFLLVVSLLQLLQAIFTVVSLSIILSPIVYALNVLPLLGWGIFGGVAIWLSLSALMGRTPYIGLVTANVRHWA